LGEALERDQLLRDDRSRFTDADMMPQPIEPLGVAVASSTPEELGARMKAEAELWGPIIKAANIKGE
jgi:hypothetical protein